MLSHKKSKGEKLLHKAMNSVSKESNPFHAKKHKKNWIAGAIGKKGALHKELGIAEGKKIPTKTLSKAAKKGGKEGKRARLAETLKGFKHGKKHMKKKAKFMTKAEDAKYDKEHGLKEGSKADLAQDKRDHVPQTGEEKMKKHARHKKEHSKHCKCHKCMGY